MAPFVNVMINIPAYGEGEFPEEEKAKGCACDDWLANFDKLDDTVYNGMIHGMEYDGKKFAYCPWCGAML